MCRVCSSTGLYEIHHPIPFYLHSNVNEFSFWTKSIASLMEEVTGFEVCAHFLIFETIIEIKIILSSAGIKIVIVSIKILLCDYECLF